MRRVEQGAAAWRFTGAVAAIWLVVSLGLLVVAWGAIGHGGFRDPDDYLRMMEVRDWIAGQGFYDVTQYRITPPAGLPMHWSRLVDMPIAAILLAARPFVGPVGAETAAAALAPLLTLFVFLLGTALVARRLAGPAAGLLAAAMAPASTAVLAQIKPLRVDHHGWQVAMAMLAAFALLDRRGRRGGAIAGACMAGSLQISLEGLPLTVAMGGLLGLAWMFDAAPAARQRLATFAATLAAGEAALFLTLHAGSSWQGFCDAVSPPQLAAMIVAALGIAVAVRFADGRAVRGAALGAIACAAGLTLHMLPPHCGADAFPMLEPVVRHEWLEQVGEGMPVWRHPLSFAIGVSLYPLLGIGCAIAMARLTPPAGRWRWIGYAGLLLAAFVVGSLVSRASAASNALAVPPAAALAVVLVRRAQRSVRMPVRVLGTVATLLLLGPWCIAPVLAVLPADAGSAPAGSDAAVACLSSASVRPLRALPPSRLIAPLDLGPEILFETPHTVLASSYHRGHAAIAEQLGVFTGNAAAAHATLRARGIGYVVLCPGYAETDRERRIAPHGFAADLVAGRAPRWLHRVALAGGLLVWRVDD